MEITQLQILTILSAVLKLTTLNMSEIREMQALIVKDPNLTRQHAIAELTAEQLQSQIDTLVAALLPK